MIFHSAERNIQLGTDFFIRHILQITHNEHFTTFWRQTGDSLSQAFTQISVEKTTDNRILLRVTSFQSKFGNPDIIPLTKLLRQLFPSDIVQ